MSGGEQIVPFANGVDAETGEYLVSPFADPTRPPVLHDVTLNRVAARELPWLVERWRRQPSRLFVGKADPLDLASVGWGVIFAPDVTQEIKDHLAPLLKHRQGQAGDLFKSFTCEKEPTKDAFLARAKVLLSAVDPKKVPYYLLIVGDPRSIPFRFQYEMDFQYAVGRIHFDDPADYGRYAENVVAVETGEVARPPRRLTFFAVDQQGDPATERMSRDLVKPLAASLGEESMSPGWSQSLLVGEQASKAQLGRVLGGEDTPALLLNACHGVMFKRGSSRQLTDQGALVCQDWPGSAAGGPGEEHYFAARDVATEARLAGMIVLNMACYGAGTPELSNYEVPDFGGPEKIAPHPFVACLPQRLLRHGALAVVGHVDRSWTSFFSWHGAGDQTQVVECVLRRLLEGNPIGHAMEFINQQHAALSVQLDNMVADQTALLDYNPKELKRLWQATTDARNFVVLGDPAVRLEG